MTYLPSVVSSLMPKKMGGLILALSAIVIVIVIVLIARKCAPLEEGFGKMYDMQNKFVTSQRSYFWNQFNKALPYTPALESEMGRFSDAVKNIDPLINRVKVDNIDRFFRKDPLPGLKKAEQICAGVDEPLLMPAQESDNNGCGWWYQDEDTKTSSGARGSKLGPFDMDYDKKHPGGKWIWNLKHAQMKEDAKKCRKVRSCELADLVPGKCGFCLATNIGIPINPQKQSKYPENAKLNCGAGPIVDPIKCPKPAPQPPVVLPDGTVTIPQPTPGICDPVNGQLTKKCLIMLAKGAGCTDDGALLVILNGDSMNYYKNDGGDNNWLFSKAKEILTVEGKIVFNSAYYGFGVCDRDSALGYYNSIVTCMRGGKTTRAREAAAFVVNGTPFDPCDYDPDQAGPFELYCLQRTAREKGCQPDGSEFPNNNFKPRLDKLTWKKVNEYYVSLHSGMKSANAREQKAATKKCLGVDIAPVPADCGDSNGLEVFWYAWDFDWGFYNKPYHSMGFYGREMRREMPSFNTGGNEFNPWRQHDRMAMHIRVMYTSEEQVTRKLWVMTDDGIAVRANNNLILNKFWDQGPTAYETTPISIPEKKPYPLDFYWYENGGGATFISKISDAAGGFDSLPPKQLTMKAPSNFPLSRWDLYVGVSTDRNEVLGSTVINMPAAVIDGKKCLQLQTGNSGISIWNGVRGDTYKSFTFMAYLRGGWARLFAIRGGGAEASWNGWSLEGGVSADRKLWFGIKRHGGDFQLWISTPKDTLPLKKWVHLGFSVDDDLKGATLYVDGKKIARKRADAIKREDFRNTWMNRVSIGHAKWNESGPSNPPPDPGAAPMAQSSALKYLGCWGDDGGRPLPNRLPNVQSVQTCADQAKKAGFKRFGVQYYGECWAGNNPDWNRAGKRDGCPPLGGGWNNQVYEMGPSPPPDCAPAKDGAINICLAWVHWFDYTMSAEEMQMDKGLGYSNDRIYKEDPNTGWKNVFDKPAIVKKV
jgi:hypothetical protein